MVQRPEESGEGAAISPGAVEGQVRQALQPKLPPSQLPTRLARQGARTDQAGMGGQQAGEEGGGGRTS